MDPIPQNRFGPVMQAAIALALLAMFAGVLFLPAIDAAFKPDADTKQTLFTLVTAVVFFYVGRNTSSASRDAALARMDWPETPAAPKPAARGPEAGASSAAQNSGAPGHGQG